MPRVSETHLNQRRQQILDAALRCFAANGFHNTSMRDVIRQSGLSAGAVYNYFPGKDDLIAAAVSPMLKALVSIADETLQPTRSPTRGIAELLQRVAPIALRPDVDMSRIAVMAWGEALRDDTVRTLLVGAYPAVRTRLVDAVAAWREAGHLPADTDDEALGQVLFATWTGCVMQHALFGDVDVGRYGEALSLLLDVTPCQGV
jgi:AcrR family transcriptional regulator